MQININKMHSDAISLLAGQGLLQNYVYVFVNEVKNNKFPNTPFTVHEVTQGLDCYFGDTLPTVFNVVI